MLWFRADMGLPSFDPAALPAALDDESGPPFSLDLNGETVQVHLVSVGNPHCVVFLPGLRPEEWTRFGPGLERHRAFPQRSNVEFVSVLDRHNIEVRMWERGVGRTCSSGTGSCASAAASIRAGLAQSPVRVHTEKGVLTVEWEPGGNVYIEGPAAQVWKGEFLWNGR